MLTLALTAFLTAGGPTQLVIEVHPDDTVVKIDGKKAGTGAKVFTVKTTPGKHVIRCEHKGDANTEEIVVKAGEKKTYKWEFTGDEKPKEHETHEGDTAAPQGEATP